MLMVKGCRISQTTYGGFYIVENMKRKTKRKSKFFLTALFRAWLGL